MAPAASSRLIKAASRVAGGSSRLIFEPASVGSPAMSNRFFTAKGTPASGPAGSPRARVASIACARRNARCSVTAVKELSTGSRSRMRASAASTTLTALARPDATAAAISAAVAKSKSVAGVSSIKYRRRLGIVRQREFVDQSRVTQNQSQIESHAGLPGRIEFQPERLCARRDHRRLLGFLSDLRGRMDRGLSGRLRLAGYLAFHDTCCFGKNSSAK